MSTSQLEEGAYPRILILAMGRINAADTSNNGLLLRNLLAQWPRDRTAQVFSGDDNGDSGFFGRYHSLTENDRRFGWIFFRLRAKVHREALQASVCRSDTSVDRQRSRPASRWIVRVRKLFKQLFIDTGLYELCFSVRLSVNLKEWVDVFAPDVIFAQGYNLAFTRLPLLLARHCRVPIVYYPTDDWPSSLYAYNLETPVSRVLARFTRRAVVCESRRLVSEARVRIAFNRFMKEEYRARYGTEFDVLMHGDDATRFAVAKAHRPVAPGEYWVVCMGDFDQFRWPLLHDLDEACEVLNGAGIKVRATAFQAGAHLPAVPGEAGFRHVYIEPCPSHDDLVSVLQAADTLFLPERFDGTANLIRTSISSKAHLFMFSGRPTIVYSASVTGIARYAKEDKWAILVDRRDPRLLARELERVLTRCDERQRLIAGARVVALRNHDIRVIQTTFRETLRRALVVTHQEDGRGHYRGVAGER